MKWNVNPLIRAIDRYIQKADEDLEEELKAEGYVAAEAAVTAINEIENKLTDLLNDYTDDLLNRMEKASDISDFIENVWSDMKTEKDLEEFLIDFLHKKFTSLLNECVKEFLIDADEQLGIDERITKPTQEFIEDWSHELARIMRLNTNKQIEEILIKSQKEAMSIEEVAKAISDSAIRSPGYRARSVALTEVLRIESYSQLEYMRQDPAVEEKEWFHTGSHKNKPRSNHVAINGQKVPKNEPFTLTGADGSVYKPMCPRDTCLPASETVNCHCIMKTIRNEKVMGMTVEERRKLREQYMDQVDEEWEQNKETFETKNDRVRYAKFSDAIKEYNNGQKDTITIRRLRNNLNKSAIGKETIEYILEHPEIEIQMLYGVDHDENVLGWQLKNTISIYASETKTVQRTAEIIIHEITHHRYNIGESQWSEAVCKAQELKHRNRRDSLTGDEIRCIIKEIKILYPEYHWR